MLGAKSSGTSPLFIIGGIAIWGLFIGLIIYISIYQDKKRRQNFRDRCQRDGLNYIDEDKYIPQCNEVFNLTSRGYSQRYSVIVTGEKGGVVFSTLDFYYHVGGKNGSRFRTLCVLSKPGVVFPNFYARTENLISDWIGEKLGGQDIDYDEDPDFSGKFVLQGANERAVRDFFDAKVRKAFVNIHSNDYEFESAGNYLVVSKHSNLDYDERLKMLANAMSVFTTFIEKNNDGNLA